MAQKYDERAFVYRGPDWHSFLPGDLRARVLDEDTTKAMCGPLTPWALAQRA